MPPKQDPLNEFVTTWNTRRSWAQQNNIPYSNFEAVGNLAYDRFKKGVDTSTAGNMSNDEAYTAMQQLTTGPMTQSPSTTPPKFTSDPWGALESDVENVASGIYGMVSGAGSRLIDLATRPQSVPGFVAHETAALLTPIDQLASGHFNPVQIAQDPIYNLIPGWMDFWNLQSSSGREYMNEHPVSSLLDILFPKAIGRGLEWAAGRDLERLPPNLANHIRNLQDKANALGLTKKAREGIIRSTNVYENMIRVGYFNDLRDSVKWAAGDLQGSFLNPLDEAGQLNNLALHGVYDGIRYDTPNDILHAEAIPERIREAYSRYLYKHLEQLFKKADQGVVMQVENPLTHELVWVSKNSPIFKYLKIQTDIAKRTETLAVKYNDAVTSIKSAHEQFYKDNLSPAPDTTGMRGDVGPLESFMDSFTRRTGTTTIPDALRKSAQDVNLRTDQIFEDRHVGDQLSPQRYKQLHDGHTRSMSAISANLETLAGQLEDPAFANFSNVKDISKTLHKLNVAMSHLRHSDRDPTMLDLRDTLKSIREHLTNTSRAYRSLVGEGELQEANRHPITDERLDPQGNRIRDITTDEGQHPVHSDQAQNLQDLHDAGYKTMLGADPEHIMFQQSDLTPQMYKAIKNAAKRAGLEIDTLENTLRIHGDPADAKLPDRWTTFTKHLTDKKLRDETKWVQRSGTKIGHRGRYELAKLKQSKWESGAFTRAWSRHTMEEFAPWVNEFQRSAMEKIAREGRDTGMYGYGKMADEKAIPVTPKTAAVVYDLVMAGRFTDETVAKALGPFKDVIYNSALSEAMKLREEGFQPMFVNSVHDAVEAERLRHGQNMRLETLFTPTAEHVRSMGMTDSVFSLELSLSKGALDILKKDTVEDFHETWVKPRTYTRTQMFKMMDVDYSARVKDYDPMTPGGDPRLDEWLSKNGWQKYDPSAFIPSRSSTVMAKAEEMYIRSADVKLMQKIERPYNDSYGDLSKLSAKGMKFYRLGVLGLSPRFGAHIIFGTGLMLLAKTGPGIFAHDFLRDALDMVRQDSVMRKVGMEVPPMDPTALDNLYASGKHPGMLERPGASAILHKHGTDYSLHQLANEGLIKGTGAGGRLLSEITDKADLQGSSISLDATPDSEIIDHANDPLINFYRKHGFEIDPEQPPNMAEGEIRMTRKPQSPEGRISTTREPTGIPMTVSSKVSESNVQGMLVDTPEKMLAVMAGATGGRVLRESMEDGIRQGRIHPIQGFEDKVINPYQHTLAMVSKFYRTIAYLYGKEHYKVGDLSEFDIENAAKWRLTPDEYAGVKLANECQADMLTHTPLEQAIIRQYIPFYGWTKHVIRFTLRMPYDHPLRVAILSQLSESYAGRNSQLPEYLQRLFFIGQPDSMGNIDVIDYRAWNPLRDVANYMSWKGFISGLNPLLQGVFGAAGINPITGQQAELFPELSYSDFYGSEQIAGGGNIMEDILLAASPQAQALRDYFSKTSSIRAEAATHPNPSMDFWHGIFDELGVPWVPYTINLKQIQARKYIDIYGQAAAAVQAALGANNQGVGQPNSMAPLQGYSGFVPLEGYNVTPNIIAQLVAAGNLEGQPALNIMNLPYAPKIPTYYGAPPPLPAAASAGSTT